MIQRPVNPEEERERIQRRLALILCLVQFLSIAAYSQISPFYPLKAQERQIDIVWVGFVIGIMAFAQILSSFMTGKILNRLGGRAFVIMFGSVLIIVQTVLLGSLEYEHDR